jgi:hypothetical protein
MRLSIMRRHWTSCRDVGALIRLRIGVGYAAEVDRKLALEEDSHDKCSLHMARRAGEIIHLVVLNGGTSICRERLQYDSIRIYVVEWRAGERWM